MSHVRSLVGLLRSTGHVRRSTFFIARLLYSLCQICGRQASLTSILLTRQEAQLPQRDRAMLRRVMTISLSQSRSTVQDSAILTMTDQQKIVYGQFMIGWKWRRSIYHNISNGAIFNRPWTTRNPDFKVMLLSDVECLRNSTRCRHASQCNRGNSNRDWLYTCPRSYHKGVISKDSSGSVYRGQLVYRSCIYSHGQWR